MLSIRDENEILGHWVVGHTKSIEMLQRIVNFLYREAYDKPLSKVALPNVALVGVQGKLVVTDDLSISPTHVDVMRLKAEMFPSPVKIEPDHSYRGMRRGRKGKTKYPIRR